MLTPLMYEALMLDSDLREIYEWTKDNTNGAAAATAPPSHLTKKAQLWMAVLMQINVSAAARSKREHFPLSILKHSLRIFFIHHFSTPFHAIFYYYHHHHPPKTWMNAFRKGIGSKLKNKQKVLRMKRLSVFIGRFTMLFRCLGNVSKSCNFRECAWRVGEIKKSFLVYYFGE